MFKQSHTQAHIRVHACKRAFDSRAHRERVSDGFRSTVEKILPLLVQGLEELYTEHVFLRTPMARARMEWSIDNMRVFRKAAAGHHLISHKFVINDLEHTRPLAGWSRTHRATHAHMGEVYSSLLKRALQCSSLRKKAYTRRLNVRQSNVSGGNGSMTQPCM